MELINMKKVAHSITLRSDTSLESLEKEYREWRNLKHGIRTERLKKGLEIIKSQYLDGHEADYDLDKEFFNQAESGMDTFNWLGRSVLRQSVMRNIIAVFVEAEDAGIDIKNAMYANQIVSIEQLAVELQYLESKLPS